MARSAPSQLDRIRRLLTRAMEENPGDLARKFRRKAGAALDTLFGVSPLAGSDGLLGNHFTLPEEIERQLLFLRYSLADDEARGVGAPCSICGGSDTIALGRRSALAGTPVPSAHDGTIAACRDCGIFFSSPPPTPAELRTLYDEAYRSSAFGANDDAALYLRDHASFIEARTGSLVSLDRSLGEGRGRRVLEVGSYTGLMQIAFARLGYAPRGLEASPAAAQFGRRVIAAAGFEPSVEQGFFEAFEPTPDYDVFYAAHVIEHVASPVDFLRRATSTLRPGGRIVFETPLFEQQGMVYGWRFCDHTHMHFFTVRAVAQVATAAGLRVDSLHQNTYQLYRGLYSNAVLVVLSPAAGATDLGRRNLHRVIDAYEDSVRRQVLLAMRERTQAHDAGT